MQEETAQRKTSVKCDAPITLALAAGFLWLYSRIPCPTVYLGDPGDSAPPSRPAACPTRPAIPSSRSWVRELARQRLEAGDPGSGLDAVAYDVWALRRDALRHRLQRAGVAVAEWRDDAPLQAVLEEVREFRRYARHARV